MTALLRTGHRVRVYVPYGPLVPGMAYLVRRILENTANESFLRRGFSEKFSPEELFREPIEVEERTCAVSQIAENHPPLDFSRAEHREAMGRALARVRKRFPLAIPLQLRVPKPFPCTRHRPPFAAPVSMPEAPVNKYDLLPSRENQVRRAGESSYVQSIAITESVDDSAHNHLRLRVLISNRLHYFATFRY